jgi:spermidine synthase
MRPFLADAQINNDLNLRLQYLAGLGLNSMSFQKIYRDVLTYRKFPDDLLVGQGGRIDALRAMLPPVRGAVQH